MPPAIFFAAVLVWAFLCLLSAVVSAAAVDAPVSYRKAVMTGVGVGAIFGIASIYLVSFIGMASYLFTLLAPVDLDRFAPAFSSVLLAILAAAIAGAVVGALATRGTTGIGRCAAVGAVFGLVVGIANAGVPSVVQSVLIPAMEIAGLDRPSAVTFGVATMVLGVIIDIALAIIAFRFVRRRWGPAPPATATGTC